MFFKRYLAWAAATVAAAALGIAETPSAFSAQAEIVNCIVAEVNGQMITLVDVKIAEAFGLFDAGPAGSPADRRRAILEKMIDQKIVLDLARDKAAVDQVQAASELERTLSALGKEEARRRLEEFGLEPEGLLTYVAEKMRSAAIIGSRFGRGVSVSLEEMEAYYAGTYKPERTKRGLEVRPLLDVLDVLETEIRTSKVERQVAEWIKNLRLQAEIVIRPDCLKS